MTMFNLVSKYMTLYVSTDYLDLYSELPTTEDASDSDTD